jgi:hypothetical protein
VIRRAALAAPVAALLLSRPAAAALPRLHVTTLAQTVDQRRTTVGATLHLTIHVHVLERVGGLDAAVVLPSLFDFTVLGDDRQTLPSHSGTDYVETVTISPVRSGTLKIEGAHLDAINATNGLPTRFSADPLTIVVAGGSDLGSNGIEKLIHDFERVVLEFLGAAAVIVGAGIALAVWSIRRRAPRPAPPVPVSPPPPAPRVDPRVTVRSAAGRLRSGASRANVLLVRSALRACASAGDEETLHDLLRRAEGGENGTLGRALRAAERAAFIEEARLLTAIDELLTHVERFGP